MPGLLDLLEGNPVLLQIFAYSAAQSIIGGAIAPYVRELENEANRTTQAVPLSPSELATLVIRNYRSLQDAITDAKENGISPDDFQDMVRMTGNPPAPEALAEGLRRGLIPEDSADPNAISFRGGIRQGDLQDKWAGFVKQLATQIPSPTDALEALLEGQIDDATARQLYEQFGGDIRYFTMLFNTRGSAPTPVELGTMANRGIIEWEGEGPESTSFHQGFLEGPWRNKWEKAFKGITEYFTPPRTITAMLREGSLTDAQAIAMWKKQGLTSELAAAYLASAKSQKTARHKQLAVSIVEELYLTKAISKADATSMLKDSGYDEHEVAYILSINDLKRIQASINRGLNTIHTQYAAHKITRNVASNYIDSLGIASDARDELLEIWTIERSARVALLTPAQIRKANARMLLTDQQAIDRLLVWGYSQADAEIFMQL